MAVFILPTRGTIAYRGKYPTRARMISGSTASPTGRHIELNDGTRLWSADRYASPTFCAGGLNDDYSDVLANAVPMTGEQYAVLLTAAEKLRERSGIAGHGRRARIEAEARALAESIVAPLCPSCNDKGAAQGDCPTCCPAPLKLRGFAREDSDNGPSLAVTADTIAAAADVLTLRGGLIATSDIDALPVRRIDVTPTWAGLVPAFLALLDNGTAEGRKTAVAELARMAKAADQANAYRAQRDAESARAVAAETLAANRLSARLADHAARKVLEGCARDLLDVMESPRSRKAADAWDALRALVSDKGGF